VAQYRCFVDEYVLVPVQIILQVAIVLAFYGQMSFVFETFDCYVFVLRAEPLVRLMLPIATTGHLPQGKSCHHRSEGIWSEL